MNDNPNNRFEDDVNDDDLNNEEEDTIEEEAMEFTREFEFVALCRELERNDPSRTSVSFAPVYGYGIPLGRVLVGNTHVKSITLSLSPDLVNGLGGEVVGLEGVTLILQYMREGSALRTVQVERGSMMYTRPLVEALSHSPGIEWLTLADHDTEIHVDELSHLLRTTRSLKTIHVTMINDAVLAQAFGTNQTLEKVALVWNPEATPPPNGAILHHLQSHQTLKTLSVSLGMGTFSKCCTAADLALSGLLTATPSLTRLSLSRHSFGEERMRHLMQGLHSNHTLTELSMMGCLFDDLAIEVVESFASSAGGATLTSIVELKVEEAERDEASNNARLVALLTAGSHHMKLLEWGWRGSTAEAETTSGVFWNMLELHAASIRIQEIRLLALPIDSLDAMSTCVPKMVYLQELHIVWTTMHQQPDLYNQFADMVRKSGSLVTIPLDRWFDSNDNETAFKVVQASLERNRNLPQLLVASCQTTPDRVDETPTESLSTEASLVPMLMLSAVQAPQMAPNQLYASMLAMSENVATILP